MRKPIRAFSRPRAALCSVLLALAALLLVSACCDLSFKLGRVKAFLSGVFELAVEGEISGWAQVEFSGDFGAFAYLPAFDDDAIETDVSTAEFSLAHVDYDVDYDASDEYISGLRAEGAGSPVVFVFWRGDKYTVDKGVCYLGWFEGGDARLAANHCGQDNGAMYCTMPVTNEDATYCERCSGGGACESCDMGQSLSKCLPDKEEGGGADLDIDIDIDIDIDLDLDVELDP
jgi:hypothetical protein